MRRGPRLAVLGRQGAGKGTQCSLLAARMGVPHLSTGDLFRDEVAAGTPLGRRVAGCLEAGALVPDDLVLEVVTPALAASDGYLLDGFPRTLAQGQALFEVLGAGAADLAVEIDVPRAVVEQRLEARRICDDCGTITSLVDGAPASPCDDCGGELVRRGDDTPEAIARRLDLYDEQALPLLTWFDSQGLLASVDGVGDLDDVHERLVTAVVARLPHLRVATS
jgi:adenylate kinase